MSDPSRQRGVSAQRPQVPAPRPQAARVRAAVAHAALPAATVALAAAAAALVEPATLPAAEAPGAELATPVSAQPDRIHLVIGGEVAADVRETGVAGRLRVIDQGVSSPIAIHLLRGGEYHLSPPGLEVEVRVSDESVAGFQQFPPGGFSGLLHGVAPGTTSLEIRLLEDGQARFSSPPIPVEVIGDAAAGVFSYDPSAAPAGSPPAGWTAIWDREQTWEIVELHGTHHLSHRTTSAALRGFTLDEAGDALNAEVVMRAMSTGMSATQQRAILRTSGSLEDAEGYTFDFRPEVIRIGRYQNGQFSTLASIPWERNRHEWSWIRFRVQGTDLMVRVWSDGEDEPEEWTLTATDPSIQQPGGVGIGSYTDDGVRYYDHISVAVGGASARMPPPPTVPSQLRLTRDFEVQAAAGDSPSADELAGASGTALADLRISVHGPDGRHLHLRPDASARVLVEDQRIARWEASGEDAFEGRLHLLAPGRTTVRLQYLEAGREAFTSAAVELEVQPGG